MATYSPNLGITLPADGEFAGTWGQYTNTNLGTLLEQAVSGYEIQAVATGTDTTIGIPNGATGVARNMYLQLNGTGGASTNLIVPAKKKLYFVFNNTAGQVTVKTATPGISVPAGAKMLLVCNGTDVIEAITNLTTAYLASPPAIGGTAAAAGTFTALTATGAVSLSPANTTVTLSPTGTGTVAISPVGALTINPTAASTINNTSIGVTTQAAARFKQALTPPTNVGLITTTLTVDCATSNVFYTLLTAASNVATVTLNNPVDGQTINIFVTQPSTGLGSTMVGTWAKWPGGTAGVLSTAVNAVDLIVATYRGTSWYATISKAFS